MKDAPPSIKCIMDKGISLPRPHQSSFVTPNDLPPHFNYSWESNAPAPNNESTLDTEPAQVPTPAPVSTLKDLTQQPPLKQQHVQPEPITTTRSGRTVKPSAKFSDSELSSLVANTDAFSSSVASLDDSLLQHCDSSYTEPHHMVLLCQHMFTFVATDPDTTNLNKALE